MINAATVRLEELTGRKFVSQKWDTFLDCFPYSQNNKWWDGTRDGAISELNGAGSNIDLPFGPLISVEGVFTYDDSDTEYAFASSNYNLDLYGPYGVIALKSGAVWPQTVLRTINGIKVSATYGYAVVPSGIKEAVKIFVGKMFENRGDSALGEAAFTIPATAMVLLGPYTRVKI